MLCAIGHYLYCRGRNTNDCLHYIKTALVIRGTEGLTDAICADMKSVGSGCGEMAKLSGQFGQTWLVGEKERSGLARPVWPMKKRTHLMSVANL